MGLFDGFPFKSREAMQKEQQDFDRRVLPFGLAQRDAARAVLIEACPGKKQHQQQLLFAFISAKDHYTQNKEDPQQGLQDARAYLTKLKWLTDDHIRLVLALVELDLAAPSLEEYPTAQQLLQAQSRY